MENNEQKIRIGVGIIIFKDDKVLVGKRTGSYANGDYAFPGGHLEYMESFEDCARRETLEECGIKIKNIRFLNVANVVEFAPKHYVNVEVVADWDSGEPQTLEPEKIGDWQWYSIDELPKPMFSFSQQGIESVKTGRNYFDIEK